MTPSGLLVVRKPSGPTSHDVVGGARRLLGTRAVGHAGTLDPMASGVLVLLVGEATKLAPYLALDEKAYRATVTFGRSTTTLDAWGDTEAEVPLEGVTLAPGDLERALQIERERTEQIPPVVSAISVDGERSYKKARRGEAVELPPRPVHVLSLTLRDIARGPHSVTLDVEVSKGYYVRSLARDLGAHLGLPAHLSALERTRSGAYRIEEALPWPAPSTTPVLIPLVVAATRALPGAALTLDGEVRAHKGLPLSASDFVTPPAPGPAAWLGAGGKLVAVGSDVADGAFRVLRGFNDPGS